MGLEAEHEEGSGQLSVNTLMPPEHFKGLTEIWAVTSISVHNAHCPFESISSSHNPNPLFKVNAGAGGLL